MGGDDEEMEMAMRAVEDDFARCLYCGLEIAAHAQICMHCELDQVIKHRAQSELDAS